MFKRVFLSSATALLLSTSFNAVAHADDSGKVDIPVTKPVKSKTNQTTANANNNSTQPDQANSNPTVKIKLKSKTISGYHALAMEAKSHIGTSYVYGGTTPQGFDCSGFTQYVYQKSLGQVIPRTAQAQYNAGIKVNAAKAKKGDLVFFGANTSAISHVGIYLGHGKMIDSQNRGVITENVHAAWWHLVGYAHY